MVTIAGLDPPDDADALALTCAQAVAPVKKDEITFGCPFGGGMLTNGPGRRRR